MYTKGGAVPDGQLQSARSMLLIFWDPTRMSQCTLVELHGLVLFEIIEFFLLVLPCTWLFQIFVNAGASN